MKARASRRVDRSCRRSAPGGGTSRANGRRARSLPRSPGCCPSARTRPTGWACLGKSIPPDWRRYPLWRRHPRDAPYVERAPGKGSLPQRPMCRRPSTRPVDLDPPAAVEETHRRRPDAMPTDHSPRATQEVAGRSRVPLPLRPAWRSVLQEALDFYSNLGLLSLRITGGGIVYERVAYAVQDESFGNTFQPIVTHPFVLAWQVLTDQRLWYLAGSQVGKQALLCILHVGIRPVVADPVAITVPAEEALGRRYARVVAFPVSRLL